ncbi:hypothetical protein NDI45_08555 [Leptolyngbya sp. GB1-A1]|uniref:hypothetical protein n=1 Tax=Leptolyngbya sp. GB1-A1 TaxID=2933908 RepID=UPI003296C539
MAGSNPISSHSQRNYSEAGVTARRSHSTTETAISDTITTRRATADEIAFRDGFVQGREQERRIQQHSQRRMQHLYAHQGMVGGLLTGILMTLTVGSIATMLAVFSPQWEIHTPQSSTTQTIR